MSIPPVPSAVLPPPLGSVQRLQAATLSSQHAGKPSLPLTAVANTPQKPASPAPRSAGPQLLKPGMVEQLRAHWEKTPLLGSPHAATVPAPPTAAHSLYRQLPLPPASMFTRHTTRTTSAAPVLARMAMRQLENTPARGQDLHPNGIAARLESPAADRHASLPPPPRMSELHPNALSARLRSPASERPTSLPPPPCVRELHPKALLAQARSADSAMDMAARLQTIYNVGESDASAVATQPDGSVPLPQAAPPVDAAVVATELADDAYEDGGNEWESWDDVPAYSNDDRDEMDARFERETREMEQAMANAPRPSQPPVPQKPAFLQRASPAAMPVAAPARLPAATASPGGEEQDSTNALMAQIRAFHRDTLKAPDKVDAPVQGPAMNALDAMNRFAETFFKEKNLGKYTSDSDSESEGADTVSEIDQSEWDA